MKTSSSRRRALLALLATALGTRVGATPHDPFGPVTPPLALPATRLLTHRGDKVELNALLRGRLTALQLMFTGCSATCPIQGAVFAAAQQRLGNALPDVQWLSISIDPLSDDPKALSAWLQEHHAQAGWTAASPLPADLNALLDALRGREEGADRHTGAAFIFDRRGRLRFRTAELPAPNHVTDILRTVATLA